MNTLLRLVLRGAVFSGLRRLPLKFVLVLGVIAFAAFVLANGAGAATYVTSCPALSDPPMDTQVQCAALAERIEANTAALEAQLENDRAHAGYIVGAVAGTGFVVMLLTVAFGPRGA